MTLVRMTGIVGALALAACLAPVAASAQDTDAHPAAGVWAHSLDTDQGPFTGDLTIQAEADVLTGTISFVDFGTSEQLEDVAFADSELTFTFPTEFGTAEVAMTLENGAFSGSLDLPGADAYGLYMSAKRKTGSDQ